ncbi:MAG: T9SS type A sorting domain-containing protein [Bacteroidetes bacterium]|nr:T9SS type A sorting domain-containing protein [Bacteroidota bacterium]HET6245269.1 T9SS type A sorting domain-containing protein [Bacteroidia bacterium]
MKKCILPFLLSIILLINREKVFSQPYLIRNDSIPVKINSDFIKNPWTGGHNFCQFSEIDLNGDGIKDLFVFDRSGNKITTYINKGIPGVIDYTNAPEYAGKFPGLKNWVLLRDYNCDGKEDIFTHTNAGIAVYRNDSDINEIKFTLVKDLILSKYYPSDVMSYNLYVSSVDIPSVMDFDGDGDMDILTFSSFGSSVELHLNNSVQTFGNCDSLQYEVVERCWGKFTEGMNFDYTLNQSCKRSSENNGSGGLRHAGSTLLSLDLTGNGALDLVIGDIGFSNMAYLLNAGTSTNGQISEAYLNFPSSSSPVNLTLFPAAFYVDVDNDGINDLLISANAENASENFKSIWYYKNQNRNDSADFKFVQDDFLQNSMIDVGEGAYPVLSDYNMDGKTDLFVGNYGYYTGSGNYSSSISLFKNTGTVSVPAFELVTRDYANISSFGLRNVYPAFGDLDGDGDLDMLIGEDNGQLFYFENIASIGSLPSYTLNSPNYFGIDVGQSSTPQLFDVNGDGLVDLLIGERNGSLNYIQNTGSINAPVFNSTNMVQYFGGVDVRISSNITGYSIPFIFKENNTLKLIVGSESGRLFYYNNIEQNLNGSFNLVSDFYAGLKEGSRTSPAGFDLNNNGEHDLFIGNYAGGLSYFENALTSLKTELNQEIEFKIFPNPASSHIKVELIVEGTKKPAELIIYNYLGELLSKEKVINSGTIIVNTAFLADGIYFIMVKNEDKQAIEKFIIKRN